MGESQAFPPILVVEDEYYLAIDLERMLGEAGASTVGPVSSVDAALALIARTPLLHGAILDVNLGGRMAFAIADALAARGVPFVFATGYGKQEMPERYVGVMRLNKPVERPALADALRQMLPAL